MLAKTAGFKERQVSIATLAKALAHPARIAILDILGKRDHCICGELVDALPLSQASVSRHLKALKDAGLIKGEIDGPRSCYCLNRSAIEDLHLMMTDQLGSLLDSDIPEQCC